MALSSQQIFISGTVVILLLLTLVVFSARHTHAQPYERHPSILTAAEKHFYQVLSSVVGTQGVIMAKVRIADLLKVKKSVNRKHFWSYFSKISQKHIDFVILHPTTFEALCVIELDDRSHLNLSRQKRDKFINQIMRDTRIPLYRFKVQRRYNRSEISQTLHPCLSRWMDK